MRNQRKALGLGACVVSPPLEQRASLWVINCDFVLVEVHGAFSIIDASQSHKILVEGWHEVARLGKL